MKKRMHRLMALGACLLLYTTTVFAGTELDEDEKETLDFVNSTISFVRTNIKYPDMLHETLINESIDPIVNFLNKSDDFLKVIKIIADIPEQDNVASFYAGETDESVLTQEVKWWLNLDGYINDAMLLSKNTRKNFTLNELKKYNKQESGYLTEIIDCMTFPRIMKYKPLASILCNLESPATILLNYCAHPELNINLDDAYKITHNWYEETQFDLDEDIHPLNKSFNEPLNKTSNEKIPDIFGKSF